MAAAAAMNQTIYDGHLLAATAAGAFFIAIVGTIGNLVAVLALVQSATLRQSPSTAFMINLPACLLPVCALGMPMFGVGCLQQQMYGRVLLPEPVVVAFFALCLTLTQVHIHTICALAFNRLVAVMWPASYKHLMQHRRVRVYLAVLWMYSMLLWIPIACGAFGGLKFEEEELMAAMDDSQGKVWKGIHVMITFMLPILWTATCYIIMYIKMRYSKQSRQVRARRKSVCEDNAVRQWDDHVTRTILVIFVFLVMCCVPHLVIHIRHLHKRHPAAWLLFHLVFWFQFCLDPLVYLAISSQYRAACVEVVGRLLRCLGIKGSASIDVQPCPTTSPPCTPRPFPKKRDCERG